MGKTDRSEVTHAVILFFIATFLFTWLLWLPAYLIQNHGISMWLPYDFFITAGTFVPSAAGFIFTYKSGGKAGVCSLLKSLINMRIGAKWLLFAFLLLPAVSAASCLVFYCTEGTLPQMQFSPWFIPFAFIYILIFMGPLGEEAGWRGFALKNMLGFFSPFKAAVILGFVWSLWHLPLFFINGTTQNAMTSFGFVPAISGYVLYTVMISVLIALLYIKSNGSVLGSVLLHAAGNLSLGVVPLIFSKKGAVILLFVLFVAVTAVICKHKGSMFNKK